MRIVELDPFEPLDDFFKKEAEAKTAAAAVTSQGQLNIRPGDIVVSDPGYGFKVFHEILKNPEPEKLCGEKTAFDSECEGCADFKACKEIEAEDFYKTDEGKYYRFTKSYSIGCPDGELGDIHVSIVKWFITKEKFEEMKARGWK